MLSNNISQAYIFPIPETIFWLIKSDFIDEFDLFILLNKYISSNSLSKGSFPSLWKYLLLYILEVFKISNIDSRQINFNSIENIPNFNYKIFPAYPIFPRFE